MSFVCNVMLVSVIAGGRIVCDMKRESVISNLFVVSITCGVDMISNDMCVMVSSDDVNSTTNGDITEEFVGVDTGEVIFWMCSERCCSEPLRLMFNEDEGTIDVGDPMDGAIVEFCEPIFSSSDIEVENAPGSFITETASVEDTISYSFRKPVETSISCVEATLTSLEFESERSALGETAVFPEWIDLEVEAAILSVRAVSEITPPSSTTV